MSVSAGVDEGMADKAGLRATIDAMIDPQIRLDAVRDDRRVIVDFVFAEANRAACEYIGVPYEALIGSSLLERSPATVSAGLMDDYTRVVETGEPLILDDWHSPRTGPAVDHRHLDVRAAKLGDGFVLTWRDVTARHEALGALAASEARMRLVLENSADVVYQASADGVITWVSPAITRVIGWRPEQVVGLTIRDLMHPDDLAGVMATQERITSGWATRLELRVRTPEGDYSWTDVAVRPIFNEQGEVVGRTGALRDITAEHEVRERLRNVIDGADVGTWQWNVQTGELVINERWAEILGYTVDELAPVTIQTWMDCTDPDSLTEANRLLEEHFEGGSDHYRCDAKMRHKDGSIVWVRTVGRLVSRTPDGKPLMMYGTHVDITEEVRLRQKLETNLHTLNLAQEAAEIGVWTWDLATDELAWDERLYAWDPTMQERPGAKVTYEHWKTLVHPDDVDRVDSQLRECIANHRPYNQEYRMGQPGGSIRYVESAAVAEYDEAGMPVRVVGVDRDITPQRELEQQLRAANQELEAIARVDALTDLPNRLAALDYLHDEYARMRRTRSQYAVLMIDLDHFKRINDTFGHPAGDEALRRVAAVMRQSLRETDHLARFGGEEFVAILPETGPAGAMKAAEKMRRAVEADELPWDGHLTVSIGVTTAHEKDGDQMAAVARADSALYLAKDAGRNKVVLKEA